jgi:hypothetical protein
MKYIKLEGPWTPVPHVPHPSHQSREYTMSLLERTFGYLKSHPTMGNERKKHRKEKKKPKKQKP